MEILPGLTMDKKGTIAAMIYDISRMVTIQMIAQLLTSLNNNTSFLTNVFIKNTLYLCLGVIIFWLLIFKQLSGSYFIQKKLSEDQ